MKKIYYLFALAALAFSACQKEPRLNQITVKPPATPATTASITLAAPDYSLLPSSDPAQTNQFFGSLSAALNSIPAILNSKYPTATEKSQITVTFQLGPVVPPAVQLVDSLYSHVAYTLTAADVKKVDNFGDLSDKQLITWLGLAGNPTNAVGTSFSTPVNNTLAVPTFTYYVGVDIPNHVGSYLYTNNAWTYSNLYTIQPAQYTALNKAGDFATADAPNIPSYINGLLKSDPLVSSTATVGQVLYVSYKYYGGSAAKTVARVVPVAFDGTNWVTEQTITTAIFTKTNGVWVGTTSNTVNYPLATADYATIDAISGVASTAAIADMKSHTDFSIATGSATGDGSRWKDVQIAAGITVILKNLYTTPATNQKFNVTFKTYGGYSTETYAFNFDGTNFVYLPTPSASSYTLTGDDYTAIVNNTAIGSTTAAQQNLNQYGDFSLSGATAWTQAQINSGITAVLKTRYTTATANQSITVTYAIYSGGNVTTTGVFKYDGTNWTAQ